MMETGNTTGRRCPPSPLGPQQQHPRCGAKRADDFAAVARSAEGVEGDLSDRLTDLIWSVVWDPDLSDQQARLILRLLRLAARGTWTEGRPRTRVGMRRLSILCGRSERSLARDLAALEASGCLLRLYTERGHRDPGGGLDLRPLVAGQPRRAARVRRLFGQAEEDPAAAPVEDEDIRERARLSPPVPSGGPATRVTTHNTSTLKPPVDSVPGSAGDVPAVPPPSPPRDGAGGGGGSARRGRHPVPDWRKGVALLIRISPDLGHHLRGIDDPDHRQVLAAADALRDWLGVPAADFIGAVPRLGALQVAGILALAMTKSRHDYAPIEGGRPVRNAVGWVRAMLRAEATTIDVWSSVAAELRRRRSLH